MSSWQTNRYNNLHRRYKVNANTQQLNTIPKTIKEPDIEYNSINKLTKIIEYKPKIDSIKEPDIEYNSINKLTKIIEYKPKIDSIKYCYKSFLFNRLELLSFFKTDNILPNIDTIVNVYKPNYINKRKCMGIGDFIRGSIFLLEISTILGKKFEMDFSDHLVSNFLVSTNTNKINVLDNVIFSEISNYYPYEYEKINNINTYNNLISQVMIELKSAPIENNKLYIAMNTFPLFNDVSDLSIIKNSIKFNDIIINKYKDILIDLNIKSNNYHIIHVRSGDKFLLKSNNKITSLKPYIDYLSNLINIIKNNINLNYNYILLCDNNIIKNFISLRFPNILINKIKPIHFGEDEIFNEDSYRDTLIDINLIFNCQSAISISAYYHGSGFLTWPCFIYNIPYIGFYLPI